MWEVWVQAKTFISAKFVHSLSHLRFYINFLYTAKASLHALCWSRKQKLLCRIYRMATMSCHPCKNVKEIVAQQHYQTTDDLKQEWDVLLIVSPHKCCGICPTVNGAELLHVMRMMEHKWIHWTIKVCVICCKMCNKVNGYCSCIGNNL
jgi:hypothetical protein